jgi:hypothetical protein
MKPVRAAILGLLFVLTGAAGVGLLMAQKKNGADAADQIAAPKEIRDALRRAAESYPRPLKGARWTTVAKLQGTDHVLFQIRGTNDRGATIEIEITGAGRVVEVEEHGVPFSEVPRAVIDALKAHLPHFVPERAEAIYQTARPAPVAYGFEGRDASGKETEVYISADTQTILN